MLIKSRIKINCRDFIIINFVLIIEVPTKLYQIIELYKLALLTKIL